MAYKAFYAGRSIDVEADTPLQAQKLAAEQFKVRPQNSFLVAVVLEEDEAQLKNRNQAHHDIHRRYGNGRSSPACVCLGGRGAPF